MSRDFRQVDASLTVERPATTELFADMLKSFWISEIDRLKPKGNSSEACTELLSAEGVQAVSGVKPSPSSSMSMIRIGLSGAKGLKGTVKWRACKAMLSHEISVPSF